MGFTEKTQKGLIKKFHVMMGRAKINAQGKLAILSAYGVEHSNDLSCDQLIEICDRLEKLGHSNAKELDVWRKRLMGAIGGWLAASGAGGGAVYIKGVACRAAGVCDFNSIPLDRLRSLYSAFCNRQKDIKGVEIEALLRCGAN